MPEPSYEDLKARVADLEKQAAARKSGGLEFKCHPIGPRLDGCADALVYTSSRRSPPGPATGARRSPPVTRSVLPPAR